LWIFLWEKTTATLSSSYASPNRFDFFSEAKKKQKSLNFLARSFSLNEVKGGQKKWKKEEMPYVKKSVRRRQCSCLLFPFALRNGKKKRWWLS